MWCIRPPNFAPIGAGTHLIKLGEDITEALEKIPMIS
jgi:hypothetical protein